MSTYTVADFDEKMDELLDKMGSDYFPLPIKLSRFESIVLNHIRETTILFEATQELSDDLVAISVSKPFPLLGKNHTYMAKNFYRVVFPETYMRFLNINPYNINTGIGAKTYEIMYYRIGHFNRNERNPLRKAKGDRINVYQIDNSVLLDTNEALTGCYMTYIEKPIIGQNLTDIILNFSDLIVDKLMQKTAVHLRTTTSDQDAAYLDDYVERLGQKNK
jgi:hypothetical protein